MRTPHPVEITCPEGHTFTVAKRSKVKPGYCPYCSGNRAWPGLNDLATVHPDIAAWWDYEANDVGPETVLPGSTRDVWWRCPEGHTWEMRIVTFVNSGVCPFCSNRRCWTGFNDLVTLAPEVAAEFDAEAAGHGPEQVCAYFTVKVPWKCHHGHTWAATPKRRVLDNNGCPYCSGNKVWTGFNDLATTHPELATELDGTVDQPKATEVTAGSGRKLSWCCLRGHKWNTAPSERTRSKATGCPYCAGRLAIPGETDLATTHPEVASWWDYEKNDQDPSEITPKSSKKAWWICPEGHSFSDMVSHMTVLGLCPYCIGRRILVGFNDLATTHPELVEQWDHEANGDLTPEQVSRGSKKKVAWICPIDEGHRWRATPNARTGRGDGCPECWAAGRSGAENDLADFVVSLLPDDAEVLRNDRTLIKPYELDVYLPGYSLAIEFNGVWWHREEFAGKTRHYDKWKACKDTGVQLITIWEDDWRDKRSVVESMISHKLGVSPRAPGRGAELCRGDGLSRRGALVSGHSSHPGGWTCGVSSCGFVSPRSRTGGGERMASGRGYGLSGPLRYVGERQWRDGPFVGRWSALGGWDGSGSDRHLR